MTEIIKTQDPKYSIKDNKIVNNKTGVPILPNEPIFIIRGKDIRAIDALYEYRKLCKNQEHIDFITLRIEEFQQFAISNRDLMKEPDSNLV